MAEKQARRKPKVSKQTIRIQYYRSFIATPKKHKQIVRSVGLTKLNQIVERRINAEDSPQASKKLNRSRAMRRYVRPPLSVERASARD